MRVLISLALCAFALPVLAEPWQCKFTQECFEEEACQQTDYDVGLELIEGWFMMSDVAGERKMREIETADETDFRAFVSFIEFTSVQMISIYPGGAAHMSIHAAGEPPFMVTYRGRCEAQP